jgi:hypothetical protein
MAKALAAFTHFDLEVAAGEELPDDHELVALAPHLFEQPPEPEPEPDGPPVRIRGPLATPSKPTTKPRTNKDA